jgi:hypothetical protein
VVQAWLPYGFRLLPIPQACTEGPFRPPIFAVGHVLARPPASRRSFTSDPVRLALLEASSRQGAVPVVASNLTEKLSPGTDCKCSAAYAEAALKGADPLQVEVLRSSGSGGPLGAPCWTICCTSPLHMPSSATRMMARRYV